MNHNCMSSPSIQRFHTMLQPNWLKIAKVMPIFHFQAGRLGGWQAGLAGQHAEISINCKQSFHLETLYQVSTILVKNYQSYECGFTFRLLSWQASLASQHAEIFMNQIYMLSPSIQRLHTKFQPNQLKNAKVMHVFHF